ncbi:hypothetical protein DPMN_156622 [Dreissena polymorpha]|uniref:Uncharacterized protein n=1 Tax=Dreissena polymorpha TaxID=45954 RepID=A0A9D4JB01_DREPO|nr:hypothetical protein DPMN_156622 [Dreissena polymorpha]
MHLCYWCCIINFIAGRCNTVCTFNHCVSINHCVPIRFHLYCIFFTGIDPFKHSGFSTHISKVTRLVPGFSTPISNVTRLVPGFSTPISKVTRLVPGFSTPISKVTHLVRGFSTPISKMTRLVPGFSTPVSKVTHLSARLQHHNIKGDTFGACFQVSFYPVTGMR